MRKRKIITVILVAILAVLIAVIILQSKNNKNNEDIFSVSSKTDLQEYISNNKIETYSFDKDIAYVGEIKLLGEESDIELYMTDDIVNQIYAHYLLFQNEIDEEQEDDADAQIYQFTEQDKENINKTFNTIKGNFEKYIGCTFDGYDVVPVASSDNTIDNEDNFYEGMFIKEYSVRDKNGVLWLMRFEASYGSASTSIYKILDESGYEGFIPRIDLTQK